jgi:hypothetical protein
LEDAETANNKKNNRDEEQSRILLAKSEDEESGYDWTGDWDQEYDFNAGWQQVDSANDKAYIAELECLLADAAADMEESDEPIGIQTALCEIVLV